MFELLFTERLMEEWHLYENQYDELSQWIKDTETDMKEESDLKATLEDKTEQLEKQQVIFYMILLLHPKIFCYLSLVILSIYLFYFIYPLFLMNWYIF